MNFYWKDKSLWTVFSFLQFEDMTNTIMASENKLPLLESTDYGHPIKAEIKDI